MIKYFTFKNSASLYPTLHLTSFTVDIGTATKMQVVFNNLYATTIAGLAEGLSLASKVGIDPAEVLELVAHTSAISPLIKSKGEGSVCHKVTDSFISIRFMVKFIWPFIIFQITYPYSYFKLSIF